MFEHFPRTDLGSAGHNGFTDHESKRHQVTFIKGRHDAAIKPENFKALASFILGDDRAVPPPTLMEDGQSGLVITASKLCWLIWLVLLLLALTPVGAPLFLWLLGDWPSQWGPWWVPALVWPPLLYAILRTI